MQFQVELWPLTRNNGWGTSDASQEVADEIAQKLSARYEEGWRLTHTVPVTSNYYGSITSAYYHFQRETDPESIPS